MSSPRQRYEIRIDDIAHARGTDAALSFDGSSGHTLAPLVQSAIRGEGLYGRWRAKQDDPDKVDEALAETDPDATVVMTEKGQRADLAIVTTLSYAVLKHRLGVLLGSNWSVVAVRTL